MAITPGRLALSCLAAALAAGPVGAQVPRPDAPSPAPRPVQDQAPQALRIQAAVARLRAQRPQLGLDADSDFRLGVAHTDRLGETHGHFQQLYKGVRVWGGDIITHTSPEGAALAPTDALKRDIHLNVTPALGTDEILGIVNQDLHPKGPYAYAPTAELVIYPEQATLVRPHALHRLDDPRLNAVDVTRQVVRYVLAYHVHTALENGPEETAHTDYLVDAQTGAILKKWSTLYTASAVGTGKSQYSGTVQINTNSTSSGYELRDMTRGAGGTFGNNVVTNLNHATSGNGSVYSNSTDTWGDGANYNGGSTTSANGQTAAVDAAYGIQCTWDMYKNVLGRDGIDDTGKASYLRVHYSTSYDNAFWDDSCFCMTFGDGSMFKSLESVDVAGHEMSHGVCASAVPGGLTYSGESGGLNEANSDIFGTMVEFYDLGGGEAAHATTIPATGGNWTIGEQLETSSFPTPLRYMYKPSLDGQSPDAWSSSLKNLDVHYSSGPMNRAFYFMSQGASSSASSTSYSSYTPNGFPGVGNDHATRIHYRALTTYYTSSETYAQARNAEISAAKDLYGAGSPEEQAVWNAFAAINVGSPWSGTANTVTASITTPAGNVTLASGATQAFAGTATDSSSGATLTYSWNFGDGATATGATASHAFTNTGSSALTRTVTFTATDSTGAKGTATRTITVNPATTPKNTVTASITTPSGNVTLASGTTQAFAGTATDSSSSAILTYSWNFGDGATATGATASHAFTNTGSSALTRTVTFTATDNTGASASTTRTVTVNPASGGGTSTELLKNGGFESGSTAWTQTSGVIGQYGASEPTHSGTWEAWLDGYGSRHTDYVYQQIAIPSTATSATLSFYLHVDTAETTTTSAYDKLSILVQSTSGTTLKTLGIFSNLNAGSGYTLHTYDLSAYKGKTIRLKFNGVEDSSLQTSFVLDDLSVKVQ